jgi:hypothetical protein
MHSHGVSQGLVIAQNQAILAATRKLNCAFGLRALVRWDDILSIDDEAAHDPELWGLKVGSGGLERLVDAVQVFKLKVSRCPMPVCNSILTCLG